MGEDSLQAVDDAELAKLAQEEKFVVALLCTEENSERCVFEAFALIKMITIKSRCEEFEGELASIREDVIDSLEDGWVVKSVISIMIILMSQQLQKLQSAGWSSR